MPVKFQIHKLLKQITQICRYYCLSIKNLGKDSVFAYILDEQGKKIFEKRYGTLTPELDKMRNTLVEKGCGRVAMESSSIYWMPIPGIKTLSALFILAEIGNDMNAFPNANSLVGWAGLRPRNDESAGKIHSRKTLHGNKYLRQILVEISWSAARSQKSFLGKKYTVLAKRMKSQKALIAITRKILVIIYNVLKTKQPFDLKKNMQANVA